MALRIVEKDCRVQEGKLVIVVEGNDPEEVLSPNAKTLALQKATTFGYPRIGVNSQSGSYPVDSDGKTYEDWNEQSRLGKINAYRNDIFLMGGI